MLKKHSYEDILINNKLWSEEIKNEFPDYFKELSEGQSPSFLYIGCSDSRLPLSIFTQTTPGEIFVHRNIANQTKEKDLNFNSVLEYAVFTLKVSYIIVAGHYDCGGVKAAFYGKSKGKVKNWIKDIRKIYLQNRKLFEGLTEKEACDRLSELNVKEQIKKLYKNKVIKKAKKVGCCPEIKGWIIDIYTGQIKEL